MRVIYESDPYEVAYDHTPRLFIYRHKDGTKLDISIPEQAWVLKRLIDESSPYRAAERRRLADARSPRAKKRMTLERVIEPEYASEPEFLSLIHRRMIDEIVRHVEYGPFAAQVLLSGHRLRLQAELQRNAYSHYLDRRIITLTAYDAGVSLPEGRPFQRFTTSTTATPEEETHEAL